MDKQIISATDAIYLDIRRIIEETRSNAVRSVDFCRVQMYWRLGQRIFEEEQQGKERADYGAYLIKGLAKQLEPEFGSGFGIRQLERARQFYRLYPIASTVRTQLNWSQYKLLIAIPDPDKREYYELESVNNGWTARETERQINSMLYERLLLSNDKESVLAVARKERIRRAGKKIKEESPLTTQDLDTDFRVLKLDTSNMEDVYVTPDKFTEGSLFDNNIKSDRTEEDLLFQVMIEMGIDLSSKIERMQIAGKTVWDVANNYLLACFDEQVGETAITEIAKRQPQFFVMRDSSLANDQVADNFEQIWLLYSKDTERRIV